MEKSYLGVNFTVEKYSTFFLKVTRLGRSLLINQFKKHNYKPYTINDSLILTIPNVIASCNII